MNIKTVVIIVNCIFLTIGICGSPLVIRLYFVNGGKRIWFASFLQTSGFPIILFPLLLSFLRRRRQRLSRREEEEEEEKEKSQFYLMKPPLFIAAIAVGLLAGFDNYLYSYGIAYIPVSTAALITSAQLGFTALFAFLMVKQKFTPFTINSIVLLTIGSAVLAIDSNSDKPANETHKKYVIGFLMTLGAAIIYGFILPLMELGYKKSRQQVTYTLVLEFQLVLCFVATCFCLVGMLISGDFKVIASEAREFKLGESVYYVVVVSTAVIAQAFFVGAIGLIFNVSSLVSGIMISALLPVTLILAVIFFHDKFQAAKGVSLALCLWGSVSYFYGQFKSEEKTKAQAQDEETQLSQLPVTDSLA